MYVSIAQLVRRLHYPDIQDRIVARDRINGVANNPPIVPMDAHSKLLLSPDHVIYKVGGLPSMPGELGKPVNVVKNVRFCGAGVSAFG